MDMFYTVPEKEVMNLLGTSIKGLSKIDVERLRKKYKYNVIQEEKKKSPIKLFLSQFTSPLVIILIFATLLSIFIGEITDAIVILVILIFNAIFGFIQEYKAEKAIAALKKLISTEAIVIRNNIKKTIPARELLPGDIIVLEEGMKVPADARLIRVNNLQCDEASITGESVPISKSTGALPKETPLSERRNTVFSSSSIVRGRALAVVIATGMNTEIGKIADKMQHIKQPQTPLQRNLANLGKFLGIGTIVIAVIVLLSLILKDGFKIDYILVAVSLAVAAVPEGLPAVVTISFALRIKRMVKKNALVRRLPAVETLGSADIICTDKTGTLTKNEMTVKKIYYNNALYSVQGAGYAPEGKILLKDKDAEIKEISLLLRCGILCNNASLFRENNTWKITGDPTEASLIVSAAKAGINKDEEEERYPRVKELEFSTERKMMTTVHKHNGKYYVFTKGAPDMLIHKCSKFIHNSAERDLKQRDIDFLSKVNEKLASKALRIIGMAYKVMASLPENDDDLEKDLTFIGMQAMIDPPRENIKDAILKCKTAGIRTIMITGDYSATAAAIGSEIGIDGEAISGKDIERMSDEELLRLIDKTSIFARTTPEHKLRIVSILQNAGHVVAVTGDGVNDAPALKKADIGVAMGITGTDVSKEASEIILLDDNFATIVNAVEEGRGAYDNIKKFVNYLLSCNIAEVLVIFFAIIFGMPLPLIAVQILWLNLLTDGFPALALGVDPLEENVMKRKPRKKNEMIMNKDMNINISVTALLITAAVLGVFIFTLRRNDTITVARTTAFTALVFYELVRIYIIRSREKLSLFSNRWLIYSIILSLLLQVIVIYTPLNNFFRTAPLNIIHVLFILAGAVGIIILYQFITMLLKYVLKDNNIE